MTSVLGNVPHGSYTAMALNQLKQLVGPCRMFRSLKINNLHSSCLLAVSWCEPKTRFEQFVSFFLQFSNDTIF